MYVPSIYIYIYIYQLVLMMTEIDTAEFELKTIHD